MVKNLLKSVRSILFADPKLLYKEERHLVNQPFYFKGTNGKAVLLIHGWTSTPYEVRRLGKFLNENGYTVYAPQLKGHGTVPKDLEGVQWDTWLEDVEKAYTLLKEKTDNIYLAGTSIGGNLAALLASKEKGISGLVLMATPYKLRLEKAAILFAKLLLKLGKKYNRKFYPPTFGVSTTITRLIAYRTYPIDNSLEVATLINNSREAFPEITQPCLIMQSTSDHIVDKKSADMIYSRIASKIKNKIYIKRAYHTFISDIKNGGVFEDILNFLEKN